MFAVLHNLNLALRAYLVSNVVADPAIIFVARRASLRDAPNIVVDAHDCVEDPLESGCYRCQVDIIVETPAMVDGADTADTVEQASIALCAALAEALKPAPAGSLPGLINTASRAASPQIAFNVCGVVDKGWTAGTNADDNMWLDTARLEVVGTPTVPV